MSDQTDQTDEEVGRERREPSPERDEKGVVGRFVEEILGSQQLLVTALAVVTALIIGAVIIALSDAGVREAFSTGGVLSASWTAVTDAYGALFDGSLGSVDAFSETIVAATPLILTGLAVALPFRAGLFNIGGEGQYLIGAFVGGLVGFGIDGLPLILHLPLVLAAGALGGFAWGFIPGILKARTGAHEVIVTIMLNNVAVFLGDYLLSTDLYQRPDRADPISKLVASSAQLPRLLGSGFRIHFGILVALAVAVGAWWLMRRSTYGFEVQAVGRNPAAALTAGMRPTRVFWSIMAIGGALAGLGGLIQLSGVQRTLAPGFAAGAGFDGITVALLGRGSALGVVLAALLFGALRAGGLTMQAQTGTAIDLVVVIQALIIIFIAAPALVRAIYRVKAAPTTGTEAVAKGWGS